MREPSRLRVCGARSVIVASVLFALVPAVVRAQSANSDTGEVAAFAGGTFGIGAHPSVGASTGLAFSRYGIALIDVAFTSMGEDTMRSRTGPAVQGSHLYDFNTSFHVRIPVRERWAPYAILGGGLLFNSFRAVSGPQGALMRIDEFNFGFHTGAGLRYYIRDDWGIRPEFKVIVSNRTFTRLTIGIFYNLPGTWP